jgi:alanine-glyoxylate transaminase/serine-glyoxylate transaminase/serine-pyruvate transaminase
MGSRRRSTAAPRNASADLQAWRQVVFGPRALAKRVKCRSFYFDLSLLEDYWLRRKYHHTMSSTLLYALYEALAIVEEEGLEARWRRHERKSSGAGRGLE